MDPTVEKMKTQLEVYGMKRNTVEIYTRCVRRFGERVGQPIAELGQEHVHEFLHELAQKKVAARTRNVYGAALRFVYGTTLGRAVVVPRVKVPKTLPAVLNVGEVERLLEAIRSPKHRALCMLAYGAGLRVGELCALRVEDIDSQRMLIRVREGKTGARYVMLSPQTLAELRAYWKKARPPGPELFPGRRPGTVLCSNAVRKMLRLATARAGLTKHVTTHTLRHCFATHLLDGGADIRAVQVLLGHGSIRSTSHYLHLSQRQLRATPSPLDRLHVQKTPAPR